MRTRLRQGLQAKAFSGAGRRVLLGTALLTLACGVGRPAFRSGIAIEHVSVVDVVRGRTEPDMTVVVQGRRVVAVRPASGIALGDSVVRVPGTGKFLVPGLWDMHVHAFGTGPFAYAARTLPLFVANGVTGIREMWGDLAVAATIRAGVHSGTQVSPRWIAAGNLVDGQHPWWPGSVVAGTPRQATWVVDSLARAGAGFIKVYSLLDPLTYEAILTRARQDRLRVAGHVPFSVPARRAAELGQVSFEHLFGIMEGCSRADESIRADRTRWLAARASGAPRYRNPFFDVDIYRRILTSFDASTCRALLRTLAARGTWQVPTLVVNRVFAQLGDSSFTADPRQAYLPAEATSPWQRLAVTTRAEPARDRALEAAYFRKQLEVVGLMARLRVPILAGTDTGNPFTYPGFSLHDELELLVRAGLTPAQALRSATYLPAAFLGATDSLGTVAPGKLADLVLLEGNPLQQIANTRRIAAVFANGRLFRRPELDTLLARARAAAASPGQRP